ncbi:mobile genetic element [Streptococcus pneumoniae]|nr:mobile genetic element [Streptococcus pneumoniae]VJD82605.1 mobile genetic element [Streptococcus pneumoniae]VJG93190.1 mobile genetic element [Streptococcus pneumoniae]VKE87977.1 mobile genetic element [Streptococcus pneumoniae]VKH14835.1 mobile genetic element [Streptococcus pneumoniae]
MNYEASKQLTDTRFKRLVGVQRTTFLISCIKNSLSKKSDKLVKSWLTVVIKGS